MTEVGDRGDGATVMEVKRWREAREGGGGAGVSAVGGVHRGLIDRLGLQAVACAQRAACLTAAAHGSD